VTLSQQVVDLINTEAAAEKWPIQFEAVRRTFPIQSIQDLDTVHVSVFDGARSSELITRGEWQHLKTIFVVIQKKIPAESPTSTEETDDLVDLLERIESLFETLPAGTIADWEFSQFDEGSDRLPFNVLILQDESTFAAVVGLDFTD
jgi:hypothetical protein